PEYVFGCRSRLHGALPILLSLSLVVALGRRRGQRTGAGLVKRDMTLAREKVTAEGFCRACGMTTGLDPCHVIPRSRVTKGGEDPDRKSRRLNSRHQIHSYA